MPPRCIDNLFLRFIQLVSLVSIVSLLFIIFFLVKESYLIVQEKPILTVFTDPAWHPLDGQFLLLPMMVGSLLIMLGAMLIALPIGLLTAILCRYYAPRWFATIIQRLMEVFAGIPAVVYGFWGVMVIVPAIAAWQAPGTSLLAGILVLTFIVTPGVTIISYHNLSQVNQTLLHSAIALGLSRYNIIRHIIFPEVKHGLITATTLQSGRAIGETLAVLMVCGNVVQLPGSVFEPIRTLTSNIALEMAYAMDTHRSALFLSGLLLLLIVLVLAFIAESMQKPKAESQ